MAVAGRLYGPGSSATTNWSTSSWSWQARSSSCSCSRTSCRFMLQDIVPFVPR